MPKLPANYVKAPSFDNPLRATSSNNAIVERKVVFHMDELTWNALQAASEREDASAEVLIQRALDRWLTEPAPVAMAPRAEPRSKHPWDAPLSKHPRGDAPKQSLREQLIEKLQERFAQRNWVQRLLTLREVLREGRA